MNVADKIVVLRHGVTAAELVGAETTGEEVVGYLTGTIAPQTEGEEPSS
jgi:ABC-type sugar transport system ATPase subunit